LKSKGEALGAAKFVGERPIDTSVRISVSDRGERDVTKRFDARVYSGLKSRSTDQPGPSYSMPAND